MNRFGDFLNLLTPMMKPMGFSKKGNSFYLKDGVNYGILNFQKSRENTKGVVRFTINFGIYSSVLAELCSRSDTLIKPKVEQCHWIARVGNFLPNSPDYWWSIRVLDNLNDVVCDVIEIVQHIILPEIKKRLSDEDLMNSWINDYYAGTTELGRFIYLTKLLKVKGDFETLYGVIEGFMKHSKGTPKEIRAIEHLREIEYSYEEVEKTNRK